MRKQEIGIEESSKEKRTEEGRGRKQRQEKRDCRREGRRKERNK